MDSAIHTRPRQLRRAAIGALLALAGGAGEAQEQRRPDFTSRVNLVTTDVVVRDNKGQFIADLKTGFRGARGRRAAEARVVFPDPRRPHLQHHRRRRSRRSRGWRCRRTGPAPASPAASSSSSSTTCTWISATPRACAICSSGSRASWFTKATCSASSRPARPSIEINLTYDRRRLDEAASKFSGSALSPSDIIGDADGIAGAGRKSGTRRTSRSATAADAIRQLEPVHDRRKAFIYISNGYDLDPYAKTRAKNEAERYGVAARQRRQQQAPNDPALRQQGNQFAFADLASELAEVTRAAVRANTTIYTIDPRGLVAGPDLDQNVDRMEFFDSVRTQQDSLRVLADLTGGLAVVNQNDVTQALKRIDQETSDYYLVGYYSSNPDPMKKRRTIEIKVKRAGRRRLAPAVVRR